VYFPTGLPDLNPTEEYWKRLKQTLSNRYFGTFGEIRPAIWSAVELIDPLGVYQYLCP
jgi:transposase